MDNDGRRWGAEEGGREREGVHDQPLVDIQLTYSYTDQLSTGAVCADLNHCFSPSLRPSSLR